MKVAIVHDWLVTYAGAERVLEQIIYCYPEADLFSIVDFVPKEERGFLQGKIPKTTFIQKLPGASRYYRNYLPLMPLAIEQVDLSSYDLILSSSHAVAKGVLVGPDQLHICLCYSPMRYAWDLQHQYLRETGLIKGLKSWLVRYGLHKIRLWDARTINGVDAFVAISHFIARRIRRAYGRDSVVIYPPVDLEKFQLYEQKEDFYLTASRMVPYKRIDMIVRAFSQMPDKNLVVIGDGPEFDKIKSAAGPNVTIMGYQPFDVLRDRMQRAKAFVFAAEEDFGIAPVEAQACGTPVIAYGKGGALETVRGQIHGVEATGLFFKEQTVESLCEAIALFEHMPKISAHVCRENAEGFSVPVFRRHYMNAVEQALATFKTNVVNDDAHWAA